MKIKVGVWEVVCVCRAMQQSDMYLGEVSWHLGMETIGGLADQNKSENCYCSAFENTSSTDVKFL